MKNVRFFNLSALLCLLVLGSNPSRGEEIDSHDSAIRIADYVMTVVGATWQYENIAKVGKSPIIMGIGSEVSFNGLQVFKREENNDDYRYQTIDENGVRVYQLYFKGDYLVTYPRPAQIFPVWVKPGNKMYDQVDYTFKKIDGEVVETGVQHYDVEVLQKEAVKVPVGDFPDVIAIRTKAERVSDTGALKGYDLIEWFARGVGAVKVEGEIYWVDSEGVKKTMPVNAVLEKTNMPINSAK